MSSVQRRHRGHHKDTESQRDEFNHVHTTTAYNPKSKSSVDRTFPWSLLVGVSCLVITIICYLQSSSKINSASASVNNNSNDLKLITVYPWPIAAAIHQIEGQTEVLISKDNQEAVRAIRTSIGMANSLRRRRRHKSILLKFTSFIASLGSQDGNKSDGDVELESYGEAKIREYLLEHGEKCSGDGENTIFQHYDDLIYSIMHAGHDDERINSLWDNAINLFTWCQFANNDARGYITHGTNLKKQQILEESRLKGTGLIGADIESNDGMRYSRLFIIPRKEGGDSSIARDLSMEILHSYLTESSPIRSSDSPRQPLLFGVHDRDLDQWISERWMNEGGDWMLFK